MDYFDENIEGVTDELTNSNEDDDLEILKKLSEENRVENFCSTYEVLEKSFSVPFTKKRGFPLF
jgi:hypothetical protein